MKLKRLGVPVALLAAAALSLTACAANEGSSPAATSAKPSNLSGTLNGIGSSAQGAAQTVWIAGFQQDNPKATVNYDPQGSGAGRKSFIAGATDFAGSDAALNDTELSSTFAGCAAGSKAIDLPVYVSPIAIAYNIDGVKDLKLDAATIAGIFSGKIATWDDAKIKGLNADASLPSAPITVVHRSDDSGTTQNFTDYLAANAPDVWTAPASQTFPFQIGDAAKGTSGVAEATKNAKNSITYIDESGSAGLSIAQLKVGDSFEKISADGAAAVVAASPIAAGRGSNDLAIKIDRKDTAKGAWPLVLVSYVIACQEYKDSAKADLVKGYIDYLVSGHAQKAAAKQAGSAPLASDLSDKVSKAVASIK
ncbi:phosphate ABC transporter substrate-binding protein [Leifsonia xyli subsp. xyli]|uniref:Phosphate-binding protein n=2 Tax=Leifsonia xyli subsp. xyli TaxID=59736 RepID=Q6ADG7_LEIXX|nr:phosphate ABC transporter substrate-binding protein PstS [Leifsonia xyli]AAT89579.1 phosphate porter [Leifsonia xyli subsp. xyli str. CTCB07]ODA91308.1 phosphate ABC transporter substrate-binding protein [Leifsonia xyli subsp. xyli]